MSKPGKGIPTRDDFKAFQAIGTRWADNDIYGHVNNVAYYSFFDTAVNSYLIDKCGLDIHRGQVIGLVVETGCQYHAPLAYPDELEAGIRVTKLGTSSVIYEIGIFKKGEAQCAANGRFVHVYVDWETRRPVALPDEMRTGLNDIA
jgi:acyl-CoA thioester hydrolase